MYFAYVCTTDYWAYTNNKSKNVMYFALVCTIPFKVYVCSLRSRAHCTKLK